MKVMIDIDEDIYRYMQSRCQYQNKGDKGLSKFEEVGVAIKNGTPLPKGHGRLIDADEVLKAMNTWDKFCYTETGCFIREPKNDYVPYVRYEDMVNSVNGTTTIIEADEDIENA